MFSGDTVFSPSLVEAARGARVLIHEAFGTEEDRGRADEAAHSVAGDVGKAASQAGVEELILTHLTGRYHEIPSPWWTRSAGTTAARSPWPMTCTRSRLADLTPRRQNPGRYRRTSSAIMFHPGSGLRSPPRPAERRPTESPPRVLPRPGRVSGKP